MAQWTHRMHGRGGEGKVSAMPAPQTNFIPIIQSPRFRNALEMGFAPFEAFDLPVVPVPP